MSIPDSWEWDGHAVPPIVRPQQAKRTVGRRPDLDLNYIRGAGVHQAVTDFRLARVNTITDWSYQQRKEVRLQIYEAYWPFPQNKLFELYYVNKMIEIEKTAGLKWFFWGTCQRGDKKIWLFCFLPQDGAIGMSSLQRGQH